MILQSFTVSSHGKRWEFVDSASLSSNVERYQIQQFVLSRLADMQDDAKCSAIGAIEFGPIGNVSLGVYESGALVGVFLIAALDYQSGPWANLDDWEVTEPNAPIVLHARPLPSFFTNLDDSLTLSVDAAHHMLARRLSTFDGYGVEFKRFSWAVHKGRDDAGSRAVQRVHEKAKADNRFSMIETIDPNDAELTRVDIELR